MGPQIRSRSVGDYLCQFGCRGQMVDRQKRGDRTGSAQGNPETTRTRASPSDSHQSSHSSTTADSNTIRHLRKSNRSADTTSFWTATEDNPEDNCDTASPCGSKEAAVAP